MEEHFLKSLVEGQTREKAEPWYNSDGDCIIYQMTPDEAVVAQRIDDVLTVYNSAITNKPIGYQIKGVMAIIGKFGLDGIVVESAEDNHELKQVSLSALLLAAYDDGPKTISRRRAYAEAFESFSANSRMRASDIGALLPAA